MLTAHDYEVAERDLVLPLARRGWAIHATVYAIVNLALVVLNVVLVTTTSADFWWFPFPLVGWGIGLTMHYLHGVRWAGEELTRHQEQVEAAATRVSGVS